MKFSFALLPNIQVAGRRSFGHNSPYAIRSPLCVLRLHLPMVQRHNSPAPLRFGSFGSSCLCFASLKPTGRPQNQKRKGRSGALPLPFLPSLPLFGCSCSLGGFSAAASAPTGHNKGGRLLFAASLRASACPVAKAGTEYRTQQRRAACRLPAPVLLCCSAPVASSAPVGCLLCGGCLLFGSVGPFLGPSCALLCAACRFIPLGGSARLLWPLPAFALLFLHKGGKRAALCSCLPLYLKRYAGGSVLLLPLCPALKRAGPLACAAGFCAFCCLLLCGSASACPCAGCFALPPVRPLRLPSWLP